MNILHDASALLDQYAAIYGAAALFVIIYGESFGLPLPGESALIAASLLAVRGDLSIEHVFIAAFAGAVLGDSTGYCIGHFGGRSVLRQFGPYVGLTPERLEMLEKQFRTKGAWIVVTARFVVVLRQLNGLVAGSMGMPWPRFAIANAVGAVLWTCVWTLGPYYFTHFFVHNA